MALQSCAALPVDAATRTEWGGTSVLVFLDELPFHALIKYVALWKA